MAKPIATSGTHLYNDRNLYQLPAPQPSSRINRIAGHAVHQDIT